MTDTTWGGCCGRDLATIGDQGGLLSVKEFQHFFLRWHFHFKRYFRRLPAYRFWAIGICAIVILTLFEISYYVFRPWVFNRIFPTIPSRVGLAEDVVDIFDVPIHFERLQSETSTFNKVCRYGDGFADRSVRRYNSGPGFRLASGQSQFSVVDLAV